MGKFTKTIGAIFFCGSLFSFVSTTTHAQTVESIGALGSIQPESGLVTISGIAGTSISSLPVTKNTLVKAGDLIATYQNLDQLNIELETAKLELDDLNITHEQDLVILKLAIEKSNQDLARSQKSLDQYLALSQNAQVSSVKDQRKNAVADARHSLKLNKAKLKKSQRIYSIKKKKLEHKLSQANHNLKNSSQHAPFDGTVMNVLNHVGGNSGQGLLVLADLTKMQVECEVYEGDLGNIKIGQSAVVSAKALGEDITGTVTFIGRQIDVERKVAKVWIDLDNDALASQFIGMEVNVKISM